MTFNHTKAMNLPSAVAKFPDIIKCIMKYHRTMHFLVHKLYSELSEQVGLSKPFSVIF